MSFFSAFVKVVVDVATLPVDVVKDVVTLGGAITDPDKTYVSQKIQQIKDDSED